MAVLTAQGISSLAIELLTRSLVLPSTVSRIPGGEFAGANGDTITVRVPQPGSARTQATAGATITYDDVTEIPVDVSLSHLYHGKLVSDEEMSLQLEDFGRQITRIQVDAVATGAEDELTTVMNALAADSSFALSGSDTDTEDAIIAASETLDSNNAPAGDRYLAVSPQIKSRILKILDAADKAGDASALRRAVIGQLYGFTVVASNALTAGTALAYHRSGFAFANRAPAGVAYATDTAVFSEGGISLRHIFQGQPDILSDASVVSTFAGAAVVDAGRVFKLTTAVS